MEETMIITILITLIMTLTLVSMYWQPSFGSGGSNRVLSHFQRDKKQEYIDKVEWLIRQGEYSIVQSMLKISQYPLPELPLGSWKHLLVSEREKRLRQMVDLGDLERILKF